MTQQEFQTRYTYNPSTDKLGEGGFGSVFKAYDNHRDRWVALKISKVNPQYETIRLRKEVEMVAKLPSHPNIAYYEECYTFPQMDGEYDFAILQYYNEGNLNQMLKNNTLIDEQKQSILMQILEGIHFLHNNGIIHRDLKPQNILMVKRGNEFVPKITDFGISKQLDTSKSSVFDNSIAGAGTLSYSSPEQLFDREIRKNTDLWSFGVIAFQTFTGRLPFNTGEHASASEAGRMELFRQVNSGQLPDITAQISEPWQTVIRRCLVTDAALRVKNAQETADILIGGGIVSHSIDHDEPDEQTRFDSPEADDDQTMMDHPGEDRPGSKSNPIKYVLIALGAAVIVFLLIFVVKMFHEQKPQQEIVQEEVQHDEHDFIEPEKEQNINVTEPKAEPQAAGNNQQRQQQQSVESNRNVVETEQKQQPDKEEKKQTKEELDRIQLEEQMKKQREEVQKRRDEIRKRLQEYD